MLFDGASAAGVAGGSTTVSAGNAISTTGVPILTRSPVSSATADVSRLPFTKTPFVQPRSLTVTPDPAREHGAWLRGNSRSPAAVTQAGPGAAPVTTPR